MDRKKLRWWWALCMTLMGCAGDNSASDNSMTAIERTASSSQDVADAGSKTDGSDARIDRDSAAQATPWSLSQCYNVRSEALRDIRDSTAQLEQCTSDADCERIFYPQDAACWGVNCGPIAMRGSPDFEDEVLQLYSGDAASEACTALVQHGCDFPPASCPTTGGGESSPSFSCVGGSCELEQP